MESIEIISSIKEIYKRFNIMPCLQLHMRTVAAVAELILSARTDDEARISKDDVIASLLLHDLGNIVKFKLGMESEEESTYWQKIQQETIAKYGPTDHQATEKMVHELGANDRVAFLISEMGFDHLSHVIDSNNMELKICLYADQRVAPYGIVSVQQRFADLRNRYKDTALESRYTPLQEEKALLLEHQIFQRSSLHPLEINDQTIAPYIKYLTRRYRLYR